MKAHPVFLADLISLCSCACSEDKENAQIAIPPNKLAPNSKYLKLTHWKRAHQRMNFFIQRKAFS